MADRRRTPDQADPPIRVVVIEPRPIFGLGVTEVLEQDPQIDVVAHVQTPIEAAPFLVDEPDVVLVDIDLPDAAPEATRRLRHAAAGAAFVVIGRENDDASIVEAVELGAVAHVDQTAAPGELVDTIHRVADGGDPLKEELAGRPELVDRLVDDVRESVLADAGPRLTAREMEILRDAAAGRTNREIAEAFGLSQQTVKNHLWSIFHKLGVPNRTRAVLYAVRQGWFDDDELTVHARLEPGRRD